LGEKENPKDLAEFFTDLEKATKANMEAIKKLEQRFEEFTKEQEEKEKPYGEPVEKPYGLPYGTSFFKAVLRLIQNMKPKDLAEFKAKVKRLAGGEEKPTEGEQARFIPAKDKADCEAKGGTWKAGRCFVVYGAEGEQYPAPKISQLLAYLEKRIGQTITKRMLTHIRTRILGARAKGEEFPEEEFEEEEFEEEIEELPEETSVLPQTEKTGEELDLIEKSVDYWVKYGTEHQE